MILFCHTSECEAMHVEGCRVRQQIFDTGKVLCYTLWIIP
jgi:hypothetical protein